MRYITMYFFFKWPFQLFPHPTHWKQENQIVGQPVIHGKTLSSNHRTEARTNKARNQ